MNINSLNQKFDLNLDMIQTRKKKLEMKSRVSRMPEKTTCLEK